MSAYDLLKMLNDENKTELQREELASEYAGRSARWRSSIRSVRRFSGSDPNEGILAVVTSPEEADKDFPHFFTVTFPCEFLQDLLHAVEGDTIEYKGTVQIRTYGLDTYTLDVRNARLLGLIKK